MQASECRKAALPAIEGRDVVHGEVELFELGHGFEVGQALEFVVLGGDDAQVGVTLPLSTDLLQLVPTYVKIVEFGAFESGPLCELIV